MWLWQNLTTSMFTYKRSCSDLVAICKLIKIVRNDVVLAKIDILHLDHFINKKKPSHGYYMRALDELHRDGAINIHRLGGKKVLLYLYPKFIPFIDLLTSEDPWEIISRRLGHMIYSAYDISENQRD